MFYMVCRGACGLGVILPLFFYHLFRLFDLVFPCPITIRNDTLWAQLLEFPTGHFETIHISSTWSENVLIVLRLSYYYLLLTFSTFSTYLFQV